jgi:hypothetical protein
LCNLGFIVEEDDRNKGGVGKTKKTPNTNKIG